MNAKLISKFVAALQLGVLMMMFSACTFEITANPELEDAGYAEPEDTISVKLDDSSEISLDIYSIGTGLQLETIPAVLPGSDAPYWEILPKYTVLTLTGYPISDHSREPKIYIFPLDKLGAFNEDAAQQIISLQMLLENPAEIQEMPFLPLVNASQMMHASVHYQDFVSGRGLRYLTEFSQGIVPVNNMELIYTYQGITSDGNYYVAAVLPVSHPTLPVNGSISGAEMETIASDYHSYLAHVAQDLNIQASNTFTPDLTQLDAMLSSLEIN